MRSSRRLRQTSGLNGDLQVRWPRGHETARMAADHQGGEGPMSEVTEAHGPTGGATEAGPVGNEDAEQYSGYLCGVCEEPLPYGAGTCIACGTPVAPLEDEEMVAGPYVFTG